MALTKLQERLLETAREAARELDSKELGSRGRELTALIGELTACQRMNLVWEPADGYDAKSGDRCFQIKTRKSWSTLEVNPRGRLGRFGRKKGYLFDVGLYVALDNEFDVDGIWTMQVEELKSLEDAEAGKRALHVSTFLKHSEQVFPS